VNVVRTFDRWHAFLDATGSTFDPYQDGSHGGSGGECGVGRSWSLGLSFDDALQRARTVGWQEEIPRCDAYCRDVRDLVASERQEETFHYRRNVVGARVDIGRFLVGDPSSMVQARPIKVSKVGQVIRLVVDVGAQCDACGGSACPVAPTDSKAIKQRGYAIMSLVDALHRAQHGLEIWIAHAVSGYRGQEDRHVTAVCVQRANAPVDIGRLTFALAHPATLRRLIFSVQEQETGDTRALFGFRIGDKYGYSGMQFSRASQGVALGDVPHAEGCTLLLPQIRPNESWNEERAAAWVRSTLEEIGL
jgi:hypothetical protein